MIQALCPTQATSPCLLRNTGRPLLQPPVASKVELRVEEVKLMEEQQRRDWVDKVTLTKGSETRVAPFLKLQLDLGGTGEFFRETKGTYPSVCSTSHQPS